MEQAYDESHQAVWPDMLDLLKRSGISEYSIFRRDTMLVLAMTIEDSFDAVWDRVEADPINTRWQAAMKPFFAELGDMRAGERFPMMREVFYLA